MRPLRRLRSGRTRTPSASPPSPSLGFLTSVNVAGEGEREGED